MINDSLVQKVVGMHQEQLTRKKDCFNHAFFLPIVSELGYESLSNLNGGFEGCEHLVVD